MYNKEVQKIAYALCGIKPSELNWITPEDLDLMISTALEERKRREYLDDARIARMTADIVNNLAQMMCGVKEPIFSPSDLMPENRGKVKEEPGLTGEQFREWVEKHNAAVTTNDAD
jgi:hypothetical protein